MEFFGNSTFDNYKVKKATVSDSALVFQILRDAASWLEDKGISQWEHLHNDVTIEEIEEDIREGITYVVLTAEDEPVATFNFSSKQNSWDVAMWGKRDDLAYYIHRLAVHKNHHNKQIGWKALNWIEENIELEGGFLRLDCIANNPVLNRFYQKAGYRFVGHVGEAEDKFSIYEKTLQ
ncbi:GNAT family N-acetyltransferase [Virgibacillus sp. C22-A2]|uniref:GNAT family N-acetyltransferase n=1 Tax=Virgibacillus tibetensis TaxID=3042313 RepID=A0ABU6KJQ1_9BACI|nr:GNAT family N-acetyltransferase [Virgibacillus sp. C22-A2]